MLKGDKCSLSLLLIIHFYEMSAKLGLNKNFDMLTIIQDISLLKCLEFGV